MLRTNESRTVFAGSCAPYCTPTALVPVIRQVSEASAVAEKYHCRHVCARAFSPSDADLVAELIAEVSPSMAAPLQLTVAGAMVAVARPLPTPHANGVVSLSDNAWEIVQHSCLRGFVPSSPPAVGSLSGALNQLHDEVHPSVASIRSLRVRALILWCLRCGVLCHVNCGCVVTGGCFAVEGALRKLQDMQICLYRQRVP